MIGLIQRVSQASVTVEDQVIGEISTGLLALIGVEKSDTESSADRLLKKLLAYRVFSDSEDKMNLSLKDVNGGLLLVPQFTLVANTEKGLRPSFSSGATPEQGRELFGYLLNNARQAYGKVQQGQFGADMQVSLTNNGPVTFWLKIR